ncbi:MAG: conjugal transfer protein TrbL family protein [Anaerotignaceae bacterium]
MFIWDFILGDVMDQLIDWLYGNIVGFLGDFFAQMGNMGVELFQMPWVQSIVLFFSQLAWCLYAVGLVVLCFETGIDYQSGKGNIKDSMINAIKGFMAVSLFSTVPVRLFELSINLQSSLTAGITGYGKGFGEVAQEILLGLGTQGIEGAINANVFGGISGITSPLLFVFIVIMMGYSVIKVFFANLKRGGILLVQISVGSLYMFSVPRGYYDEFIQWCKQIIGLCLTTFLQATILTAGLMVLKDNCLLGLGLMLSAGEVPRIAGAFGVETSTKANFMSAVYTAQTVVNTIRTVSK